MDEIINLQKKLNANPTCSCYEIQGKFINVQFTNSALMFLNIWLTNSGLCLLENPMLQVKSHCFSINSVLYSEIWGGGPHYAII